MTVIFSNLKIDFQNNGESQKLEKEKKETEKEKEKLNKGRRIAAHKETKKFCLESAREIYPLSSLRGTFHVFQVTMKLRTT
jgi:hypothetical protein